MKHAIRLFFMVQLACVFYANAQVDTSYQEVNPFASQRTGFSIIDTWPQYPGGVDGIATLIKTNVKYPKKAIKAKAQGVVVLSYLVEVDGSVSDIKVVQSVHPALDSEAIRVMKLMETWKPAIQRGKPVKMLMQQQFSFKL